MQRHLLVLHLCTDKNAHLSIAANALNPHKWRVCHLSYCVSLILFETITLSNSVTQKLHKQTAKDKALPYSLPSVGSGADPGVQAVNLQVTKSSPGGWLPLLSDILS